MVNDGDTETRSENRRDQDKRVSISVRLPESRKTVTLRLTVLPTPVLGSVTDLTPSPGSRQQKVHRSSSGVGRLRVKKQRLLIYVHLSIEVS